VIYSTYYHGEERAATDLTEAQIRAALADPAGVLWVDLEAPADEEARRLLGGVFHFHELTIQDCLGEEQRPKLEDFGSYVFLVLHSPMAHDQDDWLVDTAELDVYVGRNFVVTVHLQAMPVLTEHRRAVTRDARALALGADRMAANLLDHVAGAYLELLDDLDEALEVIEDEVFSQPRPDTIARLFQIRRQLVTLRRLVAPQREVLNRLAWDSFAPVRVENRLYFREGYDRLVRVIDLTESLRDLAGGVLETYLSIVSNQLNLTMRWLAALSTIFLPLTLIASIYGMNFADLPPFQRPNGWMMVVGGMLLIAVSLMVVFRRRRLL
jgi:magnesium transporter